MKPSSSKDVRNMYEASAEGYAKMMDQEIELPVYKDMLGRLHENIAETPGALLDIACGSGHMLELFCSQFDPSRSLIGIDISPGMVAIAAKRLGKGAKVMVGDMRSLTAVASDSVAGIINFFAIHHIGLDELRTAMREWNRVLARKGSLILSAWEGSGTIDYGEEADIVALRYTSSELSEIAEEAGLTISRCAVEAVIDFPMSAVYLECLKK